MTLFYQRVESFDAGFESPLFQADNLRQAVLCSCMAPILGGHAGSRKARRFLESGLSTRMARSPFLAGGKQPDVKEIITMPGKTKIPKTAPAPDETDETNETPTEAEFDKDSDKDTVFIRWDHLLAVEEAYYALCALEYTFRYSDNEDFSHYGFLFRLITTKMKPAIDSIWVYGGKP